MYFLRKFLLLIVFAGCISADLIASSPPKELMTAERLKKWKAEINPRFSSSVKFDTRKNEVQFDNYDSGAFNLFYDTKPDYKDFRLDCVVNFKKIKNKYSGLNIYLRAKYGKHYWVFWRPKYRGLNALKVRSHSKVIYECDKGKKICARAPKIKFGKDYTLSVQLEGRRLQVFIDGKKYIDLVDPLPEYYPEGKIGFHSGNAVLAIKSVKITDLNTSKKLNVKSYKYLNPPEKGDKAGNILTDGKINGKNGQALWWLATKGDPEIVFDLGKTFFVSGIELKAKAVPSANISAYRVFASADGKKWKMIAGEVNNSTDSRDQIQTLKTDFSTLARYLKVMLFRQAGDATIKLDEVVFIGRKARPEDKAAVAKPTVYYKGDKIPAASLKGSKDRNYYYLESGGLRFAIDRKKGNLGPVIKLAGKKRCIMVSNDKYYVETRKSAGELSEKDNLVIKKDFSANKLVLTCKNNKLSNVDIVQTYKTTPHGISKVTEFVNRGNAKDLFVTVQTGAILDQNFRENGWYLGADRGLGGRVKASLVTMPMGTTCHSPKNTKVVLFMNYDKNFGIGQFRHAINGEYCNPITSRYFEKSNHAPIYTPNGWKMGLITLHLEKDISRSVETRWHLFKEDEFNFFKQYTSIPEVNERFNIQRPNWLLRLKTIVADHSKSPIGIGANKDIIMRSIKRSYDLYDDGYIYNLINAGDLWGDWYKGERFSSGYTGEKINNDYVRELVDEMRQKFPDLKTGVYTWAWTGWPYSNSYKNHPEWFIPKNKNGYIKKAYQNGPINYLRRISAPGCMEDLLDCADKIIDKFDSDFFYIDGGGGGANQIDWQRLKIDYDTDWQKFHWGLNKACRKNKGRERAFFTNSRGGGFVDIGFYEGINNKLSSAAWRDSGDAMLAVKMRSSLFPKITIIPIYWRSNTLPFYSNYCVGMGLVPENIYAGSELAKVPYVTAAYENRMFSFVPAKLTPDWRRNQETEFEIYTMVHEPAAIFSIINHSKLPIKQKVSADAARLGIDVNKPVFSWLLRMKNSKDKKTGVSERTARKVYSASGWGIDLVFKPEFRGLVKAENGRISITDKFDKDLLNLALFTNCPAVVYSTNGRRNQVWQPNARGITVNGSINMAAKEIAIETNKNNTADVNNAELLVYIPNNWQKLEISGAEMTQEVMLGKQRFAMLKLDDFGKIKIKSGKLKSFKLSPSNSLELNNITVPGKLNLPKKADYLTVYHKGIPVFFGKGNSIDLPKQLCSGTYKVQAVCGDKMYSGEFQVESSWKYNYPSVKPVRKKPLLEEKVINKTFNGIQVLKSGINSYNMINLPLFAEVKPEKLSFAAGNTDYITSQYGYSMAGLEIAEAKVLQLHVKNNFYRRWSNYDRETRRPGNPKAFAGLIVDYHTPGGYTKRVALGMGLIQASTPATQPSYGKASRPDVFVRLKDYIHKSKEAKFSIDLRRWAPADWDGRVWISAAVNGGVMGGRKLFVNIIGNSDSAGNIPLDEGELISKDLKQPELTINKVITPVKIDGSLDDKAWKFASSAKDFKLTSSLRKPSQETEMLMCRDSKNLYIAVRCSENERDKLIADSSKIWGHDAIDMSFAPLPRGNNFHKLIINFKNEQFQQTFPPESKQQKWKIKNAVKKSGKNWSVEMSIPLAYIKLKDNKIAFNLLRYRPDPSGVKAFSWSLLPIEDYLKPKWFGTIRL